MEPQMNADKRGIVVSCQLSVVSGSELMTDN
jgi:hypothetical protein